MPPWISWTRSRTGPVLFALVLAVGAGTWPPPAAPAQAPAAEVTVVDGDTLEIDGRVIRLYGIDAPELGQTCLNKGTRWRCGLEAALELRRLIGFWGAIVCAPAGHGPEESTSICHGTEFQDPAEVLLARGLAVALPNAVPAYKRAEVAAKRAKMGIWRGEFVTPWDWRQGARLPGSPGGQTEECDVKGIVTDKGNRVYYVPTDKGYADIAVRAERGERMFCSDDAAELAGWRRYPRN